MFFTLLFNISKLLSLISGIGSELVYSQLQVQIVISATNVQFVNWISWVMTSQAGKVIHGLGKSVGH